MLGTYDVGKGPFGVTGEGTSVWITSYFDKSVTKLSASTGANLGKFTVGDGAAGIVFDGTSLWIVNNGDSNLMKVTPAGTIVSTYATGKGPFSVAVGGGKVWVPNFASNTISMMTVN